jgi:hypothetical protein
VIHGDADDFAPIELAEKLVAETRSRIPMRFWKVAGANHFLNDGPVDQLLGALENCVPPPAPAFRLPNWQLPKFGWFKRPDAAPLPGESQAA